METPNVPPFTESHDVSTQGDRPYHLGPGLYLFFQGLCVPDEGTETLGGPDLPRGQAAN